ncbi:MAG TPA: NUDIX domain-containing protein [Nitrososphaerales archaeon]|nr:NUDIX domain-containing protein [Nitrososphaerales archaeon]
MRVRDDRVYPARPMVGVGALIYDREGRILLVKRKFDPNKGRWAFPGGMLEVGETLAEAARREAREELSVEVKLGRVFQVVDEIIKDAKGRVRYHFVTVDFLATLPRSGAKIELNEESEGFEWCRPEEVEAMDVSDNIRSVVDKFLREGPKR